MVFTEFKDRLFSKRRTGRTVKIHQSHSSQVPETTGRHKSDSIRQTDVLLNVLPVFEHLIKQCETYSNDQAIGNETCYRRTEKYKNLGHASVAIKLLGKHLTSIQENGKVVEFEDSIPQIYNCLESMLGKSDNVSSEDSLRELWEHFQAPFKDADSLIKVTQDTLNSRGNAEWKTFSQSLGALTDQLQCVGHDLDQQNLENSRDTILRRPLPGVNEFIGHALSVTACTCSSHTAHERSLRLCTYKRSSATVRPEVVTILGRELPSLPKTWVEFHIHRSYDNMTGRGARDSDPLPSPRFPDEPSPMRLSSSGFALDSTSCIYECYKPAFRPEIWRINLHLEDSKVLTWLPDKRDFSDADLKHQVSLSQLVSPNGSKMSGLAKMTLSVFLAYSMFYLFGRSLTRQGWKRENIVFFAEGSTIPMRPFFKVSPLSPSLNEGDSEDEQLSFHRFPEFLELGIMLLEIHFGEGLESLIGRKIGCSADEHLAAAWEVFEDRKLDIISRSLREAVGSCLKPDFNMDLGDEDPDDEELRSKIFDTVVQPLEEDLKRAFQEFISIDALDNEASTKVKIPFQFSSLGPVFGRGASEQPSRTREAIKTNNLKTHGPIPRVSESGWRNRSHLSSSLPRSFELFSNESQTSEPTSDMINATDDWMKRFVQLVEHTHVKMDEDLSNCEGHTSSRLKVAILDTGIDINHPLLYSDRDRVKDRKSWTGTPADEDISGHGTHIASTILSLTRNVDIYIAKITDSNVLGDTGRVADAINFACQEWEVDIISLSFGFQRGVMAIQKAINKAVYSDRNTIIFAAASNDASNAPRAYPAKHDRVICVHSADGSGDRSKFNPTAVDETDNFCVLGENIQAAWPQAQGQYQGLRRMSGTSFATPVAVAIAAFMIAFMEKKFPDHPEWLTPLKSYGGVRAMFNTLSQKRDGAYRLVNPLYEFSRDDKAITQVLCRIESELNG